MSDDFFSIPGDVVREAEAAAEFKLVVPETARTSARSPDTYFWTEAGNVKTAQSGTYISPEGLKVFTFEVVVTITGAGSGVNIDRDVDTTFRICPKALGAKSPKNLVTMSNMSIAKLKGFFTALGIDADMEDGGFSPQLLREFFPPAESDFPSGTSPALNRELYFQVKQSPYETKDGQTKTRAEIHRFMPGGEE